MSAVSQTNRSTIIPCLRYRDAPAAIDWLCSTFGFRQQLVVPGENNTILHAQLTFDNGMIMLGSTERDTTEYGKVMTQPDAIGGAQTQTIYVVVPDPDAIYARVRAAGGRIVMELKDEDYGGRGFTCRDLEQHVWSFGTYDPFA